MAGCQRCSKSTHVATLTRSAGKAEKQFHDKKSSWVKAQRGTVFSFDDALRTGAQSQAWVSLDAGSRFRLGELSEVRFLRHAHERLKYLLHVETGAAEIVGGDEGLAFETEIGVARVARGSKVEVNIDAQRRVRLGVIVGTAVIERKDQATITLRQGQSLSNERVSKQRPKISPWVEGSGLSLGVARVGAEIRDSKSQTWTPLTPGKTKVSVPSYVKSATDVELVVQRGQSQAIAKGPAQVLVAPKDTLMNVSSGKWHIVHQGKPSDVRVPGGSIAGSTANTYVLEVDEQGATTIIVEHGQVDVQNGRQQKTLLSGESATLSRKGRIEVVYRVPQAADFVLPMGESAVIHDTIFPIALRIRFGKECPTTASVEVPRSGNSFAGGTFSSTGQGSALVYVNTGSMPYRVRCDGSSTFAAQGTLKGQRDSGRTELPKLEPANLIDADGRNYTIFYQHLLPQVTFRWRPAPEAQRFTLHLQNKSGQTQHFDTESPTYTMRSGQLAEGVFRFWFEATEPALGDSQATRIRVAFDNAAPSVTLRKPEGSVKRGIPVEVSGVVIPGWHVSIGGRAIPLDPHSRFNAQVTPPTDENVLAIRIAHKERGVHYYLRRLVDDTNGRNLR